MTSIKAKRISVFRKLALSLWNSGGDPSVYSFLEIDVTDVYRLSSPMPFVVKAVADLMGKHKELNSILRFGHLYYRQNINVSVMVHIPGAERHDLSIATIENVDCMGVSEIEQQLRGSSQLIRERRDPHLGFALSLIHRFPLLITKFLLKAYSILTHDLNLNLSRFRLPKGPFGSVIVTNIGSLGLKKALVPLVPFSRAPLLLSVGKITKEPRVVDDRIEVRQILHVGVTFDHRFFDGSHAAAMVKDFEESLLGHMRSSFAASD